MSKIMRFIRDDAAATAIEYGLIAAADPAPGKKTERDDKNDHGRRHVPKRVGHAHPGHRGHDEKTADQDQRDPVGDRHGEKVARRSERHHCRKQ